MGTVIHHEQCPLCAHKNFTAYCTCNDLLTHEQFTIMRCARCSFLWTQDAPTQERIGMYYASNHYLPHEITRKGLRKNLLQYFQKKLRSSLKIRIIKRYTGKRTGTVLDCGCGNGESAYALQSAGWHVTATELDERMRAHCKQSGIDCRNPEELDRMPSESVDTVIIWHSLEHMHNLHGTMAHVHRLLKKEGVALIALPTIGGPLMHFYGSHDVPRHLWHFRPATFQKLASMHGLTIRAIHPLRLDAIYMGIYYERMSNGWPLRGIVLGIIDTLYGMTGKQRNASLLYVLTRSDAHSASS